MKINGKKIHGANTDYVVFPRGEDRIVFKIQALGDMKAFEALVPTPKPGTKMVPGGIQVEDRDDVRFKTETKQYSELRFAYTCLASLSATEGLEWETVKLSDPNTWLKWEQELLDSGFNQNEVNYLQYKIISVNALNQDKLEEARASFLLSLEAQRTLDSSQTGEPQTTPSGVDVNALV
jgi:hypothetical protein